MKVSIRLRRKLLILLLELLAIFFLCSRLAAAETLPGEEGPVPEAESTVSESASDRLFFYVDDAERYSGMTRSYRDGYVPARKGRKVTLVMPLLCEGMPAGGKIRIRPDLGEVETSPFLYRNYQKTLGRRRAVTASGEEKKLWLVRLVLTLKKDWKPGVYPVILHLQAAGKNGEPAEQEFAVYVTLQRTREEIRRAERAARAAAAAEAAALDSYDGGGYSSYGGGSAGGGGAEETKPLSQPVVLVTDYCTQPSPLRAGETFTLTFTLKNNSSGRPVQNMTVALSCGEEGFLAELPGGTMFAGGLPAGAEESYAVPCRLENTVPEGILTLQLQLSYDNEEAQTLASSGTLQLPVTQTVKAELSPPLLPASVRTGDTQEAEVQVSNIGGGKIHNARLQLDAPGLSLAGNTFLGEIEGGSSQTAAVKFFVRTLRQNTDGSENASEQKYGDTRGTLTLIYEDGEGQEYRESAAVFTNIAPMEFPRAQAPAVSGQAARDIRQWQIAVALAAGVLLSVVFSLLQEGRRRLRGR